MPQLISQLSMWQTVNDKEKIINLYKNDRQSIKVLYPYYCNYQYHHTTLKKKKKKKAKK